MSILRDRWAAGHFGSEAPDGVSVHPRTSGVIQQAVVDGNAAPAVVAAMGGDLGGSGAEDAPLGTAMRAGPN